MLFVIGFSEDTICSSLDAANVEVDSQLDVACRSDVGVPSGSLQLVLSGNLLNGFVSVPDTHAPACGSATALMASPTWRVNGTQLLAGGFQEPMRPPTARRSGAAQYTTTRRRSRSLRLQAFCLFSVSLFPTLSAKSIMIRINFLLSLKRNCLFTE